MRVTDTWESRNRKIREQLKEKTCEQSILNYLGLVKDLLSPTDVKTPRTPKEKLKSKNEAEEILATLVPDMAANVVGRANAAAAGRRLFAAVNNQRLK